jgi:AcrR family transcriptional regulator
MGRKPHFTREQFIDAALDIVAESGPAAVTISSVAGRINAPVGSVYHRFTSRDEILAELWLRIVDSFQQGFLRALEEGDGLKAALHTPRWARANPNEGCILLLYRREELISSIEWPESVRERALSLARELDRGIGEFVKRIFGHATRHALRRAIFVLIDIPYAAVRRHLQTGEKPPDMLDELVSDAYTSILGGRYESI